MRFALALAVLFVACQPDEPKTPPNSPLPEIDKQTDPKPAPPPFGDGGVSSVK